ncbi:MAG TPA: carboxypeptidase regulatory-like domain-containing protein [Pyrinomonadaceae bacterium]|nr:carboxypeptidase regulatory-like domain-containing protein [Pyrinomonadaceae bacterium]
MACGACVYASAKTNPPVLVSEPDSTRAIALESVTFTQEPFSTTSPCALGEDQRTRVMLFALNLGLQPGEDLSALTADAEDAAHKHYDLKVEYVGHIPSQEWLSTVILKLNEDMGDVGDVLVRLSYNGTASNRVRIGIGHTGGGPPDDSGATPTPAPPYTIKGRVIEYGAGLGGVLVTLTGAQNKQAVTDDNGFYSFTVTEAGDYTVTPSKTYYDVTPQSLVFNNLSNHQTGANFDAKRYTFAVSGRVTDEAHDEIAGIIVNLSGGQTFSTMTDSNGNYSFPQVAAGLSYTITPVSTIFYNFNSQSINNLINSEEHNFTAALREYDIAGRVTDGANGIGGATVSLSGSETKTVQTDDDGNYSFKALAAGDYTVTASKTRYIFSPQSQSLIRLSSAQTVNFNGALQNTITGRVTDAGGRGLIGVTITLSGSENAKTVTDGDGNYSLSATAGGFYTVTPSIEQDYYTFAPASQAFNSLTSDQTANFSATLLPVPNPFTVLEFDGSPKSVDYGYYWNPNVNLGHFYWEFWARPGNNASSTYMLSDGYGGAHALLFGVANYGASEPGRYQLLGDIYDEIPDLNHTYYFGGDQGPAVGEWAHMAVGWDGQNIITYYNGVPVGRTSFTGSRRTPGFEGGGSRLLIGGSDHSNFVGRIAEVRGYEDSNPREDATDARNVESSFIPQTVFSVEGNLLSYFFRPSERVADLSRGYNGIAHAGQVRGTINGILNPCPSCPPPQFVTDTTAPNFVTNAPPQPVSVPAPSPAPEGAMVFDSFGRDNSTYLFDATGGLDSTEGGSAGQQVWQVYPVLSGHKPFGILNGVAVLLGNSTSIAWVQTGSATANLEVSAERRSRFWNSGVSTGLSFRVTDERNYFFAYTSGDLPDNQKLTLGFYMDGHRTDYVTGWSMPAHWTTLRVLTTSAGSIIVYADSTLVFSMNTGIMATATGAGLYNNAPDLALVNRWDNFTVYDAP